MKATYAREMEIEVTTDAGIFTATVGYNIWGRYRPATRIDPAEYPEVEWDLLKVEDKNGTVTDPEIIKLVEEELKHEDIENLALEMECDAREAAREDRWRGDDY